MRLILVLVFAMGCAEESPTVPGPDADPPPLAVDGLFANLYCTQDPRVGADTPRGVTLEVSGLTGLWVVADGAVAQAYDVCSVSSTGACATQTCATMQTLEIAPQ